MSPAEKKVFQRRAKEANEAWKRQQKELEAAQAAEAPSALHPGLAVSQTNTAVSSPQMHQGGPFALLSSVGQQSPGPPLGDPTGPLGGEGRSFSVDTTSSLDSRAPPSLSSSFPPAASVSVCRSSSPPPLHDGSASAFSGDPSSSSTPQTLQSTTGPPHSTLSSTSTFAFAEHSGKEVPTPPPHPLSHPSLQNRLTPPSSPFPVPPSRSSNLPPGATQRHIGPAGLPSPAHSQQSSDFLSKSVRPSPYASLGKRDFTAASLEEAGGGGLPLQKKQRGEDREQENGASGFSFSLRRGGPECSQQHLLLAPSQGHAQQASGGDGGGGGGGSRLGVSSFTPAGVIGGGQRATGRSPSGGDLRSSFLSHPTPLFNNMSEGGGEGRAPAALGSPSPPQHGGTSSFLPQQTPPAAPANHRLGLVASAGGGGGGDDGQSRSYVFQEVLSPPSGALPSGFLRPATQAGGGGGGEGSVSGPAKVGGFSSGDRGGMPLPPQRDGIRHSSQGWGSRDQEEGTNAQIDDRTRQFVSDPVCTAVPPSPRRDSIEESQGRDRLHEERPGFLALVSSSAPLPPYQLGDKVGDEYSCGRFSRTGEEAHAPGGRGRTELGDCKTEIACSPPGTGRTCSLFSFMPISPPEERERVGLWARDYADLYGGALLDERAGNSSAFEFDVEETGSTGGLDGGARCRRKEFRTEALFEAVPPAGGLKERRGGGSTEGEGEGRKRKTTSGGRVRGQAKETQKAQDLERDYEDDSEEVSGEPVE